MGREIYKLTPTTGTMRPEKIVSRAKELSRFKKALDSQSVLIEEVRRMGKTFFVKKYASLHNENQKVIYLTLQGKKDVNELIDSLLDELRSEQKFGKLNIGWHYLKKLYNNIKPEEIDISLVSLKLPEWKTEWKKALTACLHDIANRKREGEESLVLILDELPIMIWDWIQNGKAEQAKEFLDVLRANRQLLEETGKIRLVICGSIGMQIVLQKLKDDYSYTGEPFNDMLTFKIGAMTKEDSYFLCECIILDDFEFVKSEKTKIIAKLYELSEGLPFYINKLFTIIRQEYDDVLSVSNVENAYIDLLNMPIHSKDLKQLEDRIKIYYKKNEADLMVEILTILSKEKKLSEKEIIEKLNNKDEKDIKESLYTLFSENYLDREFKEGERSYSFKYKIVKEWWRINMA